MKKIALILIFILLFVVIYYFYNKTKKSRTLYMKSDLDNTKNSETIYMKSGLNNRRYLVQKLRNKEKATDILGIVHNRIFILRDYLEKNMDKYPEYKPYIKQFCSRIDNLVLTENSPDGKYTSYTVNKGEEMVLCLRSKKSKELHDLNLVMYVVLHELAHIACPEIDHTELFKKIFMFLIKIAVELDIYELVDYQIDPHEYCGMIINENLFKN